MDNGTIQIRPKRRRESIIVGIVAALFTAGVTFGIMSGVKMSALQETVNKQIEQMKGDTDEQKKELMAVADDLKKAVEGLDRNQKQILPNEDFIIDTSRKDLAKRVSSELGSVLTPAFDRLSEEMGGQKQAFGEVKEDIKKRLTGLYTQIQAENAELKTELRKNQELLTKTYEEGKAADASIQQGVDKSIDLQQKTVAEEKMTNEELRSELRRTRTLQEKTYTSLKALSERYLTTLKGQNALSKTGSAIKDVVTLDIARKKNIEEERKFVEEQLSAINSERSEIDITSSTNEAKVNPELPQPENK